jgi:myo-inositol-1(or 4)-monophosphatase
MNDGDFLNISIEAAIAASYTILEDFPKLKDPAYKGKIDLVTKTDTNSELIIKSIISKRYPDHAIIAEEGGHNEVKSDYLWIIDPLDGTTNFVHGCPPFSISIALYKKDIPILGIVLELPSSKLYTAIRGEGAFCEGEPISGSSVGSVERSLLATGFSYDHDTLWEYNMEIFKELTRSSQGVRRFGSAALDLCYVAEGKFDGFWEFGLKPWDTAAGIIIADEAGCEVTNIKGQIFSIYDNNILVTNQKINREMINLISNVKTVS